MIVRTFGQSSLLLTSLGHSVLQTMQCESPVKEQFPESYLRTKNINQ